MEQSPGTSDVPSPPEIPSTPLWYVCKGTMDVDDFLEKKATGFTTEDDKVKTTEEEQEGPMKKLPEALEWAGTLVL